MAINVGLLGAGRISSVHLSNLAADARVERVWIYDPLTDRAVSLAESSDAHSVASVDELLEVSEAVVIASSTDSHAEFLQRAAAVGIPAFCEKPIALDLETTDQAVAAVLDSGIPVQMGFNRRFDPGFREARDVVEKGELGSLMAFVGHHHDYEPPPEEYIAVSGGQFKDQLIHDLDLVRFVTGEEVVQVHAAGSAVGEEVFERCEDTAVVAVTLWLESGAVGTLTGVRKDPVGYDVRMELFGTRDSIAVGLDERTPIRSVEPGQKPPQDPYSEWLPRFGDGYAAEMSAFLDLVEGQGPNYCTVEDARAAMLIAEACGQSLRAQKPIEINVKALQ